MKQTSFISKSEADTLEFAKKFASNLKTGDIIVLSGNLGSGKTKFTQGILSFFNLDSQISSPTFTIVNEYKKNDINIFHFDLYRLQTLSEFIEMGGEEYFEKGICIIEWGELVESILPPNYIKIEFERDYNDFNKRIINITTHT